MDSVTDELRYEDTQPYRLGNLYQELGERLMDPRTDLRDLVGIAHRLGLRLRVEMVELEQEPETQ